MADNLTAPIDINLMVDQFLDIMIVRFLDSIGMQNVGTSKNATGDLVRSFKKALFYSGGDVQKASLTFLQCGRFVDMGVGRGSHKAKRARKPWYAKTKTAQIKRFREILSREYNKHLIIEIEKQLTQSVTLNNVL